MAEYLLDIGPDKPIDRCAVVAVDNVPGAAEVTRIALGALNHRGQDFSGIAVPNRHGTIDHFGGEGLVRNAYDKLEVASHAGRIAIGHNRYATSGGSGYGQPTEENGNTVSLAHNGNLPRVQRLVTWLTDRGIPIPEDPEKRNDSKMVSQAVAWCVERGADLREACKEVYELIAEAGAFCIVATTGKGELVAMRDQFGIRPLSIGTIRNEDGSLGHVVASETYALDQIRDVGGRQVIEWRDVRPGEMIYFGKNGPESEQLDEPKPHICAVEYIYSAHPESIIEGRSVKEVRRNLGRLLAKRHPVDIDVIVPVPNSGIYVAQGYAEASGIRYEEAIEINPDYKGTRAFMKATPAERQAASNNKLVVVGNVRGLRVGAGEDSIFRGDANVPTVRKLREAGAKEVHVLVGSPPVIHPNELGIATPTREELIATGRSVEQIRLKLGPDYLGYITVGDLVEGIGLREDEISMPDFTGRNIIIELNDGKKTLVAV